MLFTHWFRRRPTPASRRPRQAFRPSFQTLEDRTVPTGFGFSFLKPSAAGPATHLQVIVPQNVQSGRSFDVIVEAEDASNHLATGYTGTVSFSLGTADAGATLPANYTFTAHDHGIHEFDVTLSATGSQTVTATDTATATITGSATTTVNPAPVATHLLVIMPSHVTQGLPAPVTVIALDASNHPVPNYTGTVHLASSDGSATLPSDYTFTAADHGIHTFQVTLQAGGTQTVTATDTATGTITGQVSTTVKTVGAVTHFGLVALSPSIAGSPSLFAVVALDAGNNIVASYTGTVSFTSSDNAAALPPNYTFTSTDHGIHIFTATFNTTGKQTLTVADTTNASLTGTLTERVLAQLPFGHHHGF